MKVRNTSSHGDTPMCQILLANVKPKTLWAGHESAQTDGQTDGRTDGRTDRQTDGRTDVQTE